jgi:ABC-type antimicrobial peptide transport system permease subunit
LSPWNAQLGLSFFPIQVATVALGLFGAFGLLLSIAGTFGLASYTVSKRLRELSIRVALGAQAKQILSAALGRMLVLLASGSVVGIVLGVAASRILSVIVYQASDPGSICACRCCIYYRAHRITFGHRSRETRPARRPGNPAPRTIIFNVSSQIWPSYVLVCRTPHGREACGS